MKAVCLFILPCTLLAQVEIIYWQGNDNFHFTRLASEVENRTSVELAAEIKIRQELNFRGDPWLWTNDHSSIPPHTLAQWIRKGGMLIIEENNGANRQQLENKTKKVFGNSGNWQNIPLDHELMRSFYLLDVLPACQKKNWRGFILAERLALVVIPYRLLSFLRDNNKTPVTCLRKSDKETQTRIFVNLLMVSLAGNYKKDQIHLPEILKRLR